MNRTLLNALIAAAAVASVCLLALGWMLQLLLERPLTAVEWVLAACWIGVAWTFLWRRYAPVFSAAD
ncbi:MAG: hypothetical protein EOP40_20365, partial [Rubrivivax sp.]